MFKHLTPDADKCNEVKWQGHRYRVMGSMAILEGKTIQ